MSGLALIARGDEGRERCSDETTGIYETFQSQGTAETELRLSHETGVGRQVTRGGAFPRPFRKLPATLPASLESAQQFGLLLGKFRVGENLSGHGTRPSALSQRVSARAGQKRCLSRAVGRAPPHACVAAISSLHRRRRRPADGPYQRCPAGSRN